MFFMGSNGHRVTAHDRCGCKRSSQPWNGDDMKTYDYGLHELFKTLDVHNVMLIDSFTGDGEVGKFLGRHGTSQVSEDVLVSAVPPLLLKTDKCPNEASLLVPYVNNMAGLHVAQREECLRKLQAKRWRSKYSYFFLDANAPDLETSSNFVEEEKLP